MMSAASRLDFCLSLFSRPSCSFTCCCSDTVVATTLDAFITWLRLQPLSGQSINQSIVLNELTRQVHTDTTLHLAQKYYRFFEELTNKHV